MKRYIDQLDKILSKYLIKNAPPLPKEIKELLVKIAPFLAILAVIFGLPAIFTVFGIGAIMTPFAWVAGVYTGTFWFFWLLTLIQISLAGLSIKPLFTHSGHGWRLMYYSQLATIITTFNHFNIFSLIFTLFSLYLLYQIKSSYKN